MAWQDCAPRESSNIANKHFPLPTAFEQNRLGPELYPGKRTLLPIEKARVSVNLTFACDRTANRPALLALLNFSPDLNLR
jgi:hypothetical protein